MKKLFALVLALAMVLSLAACGDNTTPGSGTNPGANSGTTSAGDVSNGDSGEKNTSVVLGTTAADYSCNPTSSYDSDFLKQGMVYDRLFEVESTTGEYGSRILESYSWTDNRTLHMTLKQGVLFNDGTTMTMEDVLYTIETFLANGTTTDKYVYLKFLDIEATKASLSEDKMSLDLVYASDYGPAINTLNFSIISKAYGEQHPETDADWFVNPVGSGPYVISDYVADAYVTFTLREDYWCTDYTYDATEITLKFYTDENAMFIDYQAGNLDAMVNVSNTVAEQVAADASLGTAQLYSDNNTIILIMNEENEYLKDPVVREAIFHAIDREYIAEVCKGMLGTAATDLWASTFDCYVDHSADLTYDVEYAKKLLADAGYKDGDITISWISPDMHPEPLIGECVQAMLDEIGITVSVESYDLPTALGYHSDGTTAISNLTCMGGNPAREPNSFISSFNAGANFSAFSVEEDEYNAFFDTGLYNTDHAVRMEAYRNCSQWLLDNHIILPLIDTSSAIVYNSRIANFPQATVGRSCLGDLELA